MFPAIRCYWRMHSKDSVASELCHMSLILHTFCQQFGLAWQAFLEKTKAELLIVDRYRNVTNGRKRHRRWNTLNDTLRPTAYI